MITPITSLLLVSGVVMGRAYIPRIFTAPHTFLFERIITEEFDVENGVPTDYLYNDTSSDKQLPPGGRRSAPGCPENEEGYPWLHYFEKLGKTTKCFLAGTRGPCEGTQVFLGMDNSDFGVCACDCFQLDEDKDAHLDMEKNMNPDKLCRSQVDYQLRVFVTRFQKCFEVYEQGPCKIDEWLTATPKNRPNGTKGPRIWAGQASCEKRTCEPGKIPFAGGTNPNHFICGFRFYPEVAPESVQSWICEERGEWYNNLLKKCTKFGGQNVAIGWRMLN